MLGQIQWFSQSRGVGLIRSALSGQKYFFHISGVKGEGLGDLNTGDRVEFGLTSTPKGVKAVDVVVVK
jgi:CspA family cold shock protein